MISKKVRIGLFTGIPALAYFVYRNFPKLNILTGFAAKNVCSCTFEAKRELESILSGDNNFIPVSYAENKINFKEGTVESSIFGLKKRKAIYREGMGCILLPERIKEPPVNFPKPSRNLNQNSDPFAFGNGKPLGHHLSTATENKLYKAVENAFDAKGKEEKRTRAVLVMHNSKLIAEKYAAGFSSETKLQGWSMTKSITNAVLGILEKQGRVDLEQNNLFQEWEEDERREIKLKHLLQMNSGLEWNEDYVTISDVTRMLFLDANMAESQLHKTLTAVPGEVWKYASGITNVLSLFIRQQFKTHKEYLDFWYSELIDKIGMNSMTLETDLEGNFIGSSYSWATARDWAKFGLLYLHNGNWNGEQILNPDWVKFSADPANGSAGEYGAHFWLNAGGKYPNVPKDMYACSGFQGQYIFIIPSKDLVVVRLGLTEHPVFNVDQFLNEILDCL